jgi:hypothetical protein
MSAGAEAGHVCVCVCVGGGVCQQDGVGERQRVFLLAGVHKVSLGLQQQAVPQP